MLNLSKKVQYFSQPERRKVVEQLAFDPIGEWLFGWNDTNRMPFASVVYKFLLVMFRGAVRKAVVS